MAVVNLIIPIFFIPKPIFLFSSNFVFPKETVRPKNLNYLSFICRLQSAMSQNAQLGFKNTWHSLTRKSRCSLRIGLFCFPPVELNIDKWELYTFIHLYTMALIVKHWHVMRIQYVVTWTKRYHGDVLTNSPNVMALQELYDNQWEKLLYLLHQRKCFRSSGTSHAWISKSVTHVTDFCIDM